jgi:signal transduction histidine kinase
MLRNIPIQRKLIVIMLVIAAVVMVLMRASFFTYEFLTFRQATLQQLSTVGKVIAANSTAALAFDNQDDAQEILTALQTEPNITAAALYDKAGKLFAKYPANLADDLFPQTLEEPGYHYQHLSLIGFQPVAQGTRNLGTLYLRLETGVIMRQWLRNSIGIAAVVIAIALSVAYLLSRILQKQISQPILSLAETARAISDHRDFSVRAKRLGNDELGLLTDAFNQMLSEIQAQDQAIRGDIAERKKIEEQLRASLKEVGKAEEEIRQLNAELEERVAKRTTELEIANKELEAFSYSVSHDLRTPLRAVDGFSQAVLEDYGPQLPEEGQRYLQTIREGAQRMGALIDDLLTFSRLSRLPLHQQKVDTDKLVREVISELGFECSGRKIDLRINDLPSCQGDLPLLKQAWINLLSNALKYTGQRASAVIEIGSILDQGEIAYLVRDNGTGFDMQYAHKLFGVFQRLHRSDQFEGTGVGLAIVQRIVHRHGGRVWAEAEVDRGATFYFTLKGSQNS